MQQYVIVSTKAKQTNKIGGGGGGGGTQEIESSTSPLLIKHKLLPTVQGPSKFVVMYFSYKYKLKKVNSNGFKSLLANKNVKFINKHKILA